MLTVIRTYFSRCSEADYVEALSPELWSSFVSAAPAYVRAALAEFLPYESYRHFFNVVLTPGMPHALPPVESLYKDWGGRQAGLQHGQGFYLGDSAREVTRLCAALEIDIPEEYAAIPDHLVLLLELFVFLRTNASAEETRAFAASHFDWLGTYRNLLAKRVAADDGEGLKEAGMFYQHLVDYIESMVTDEQTARSA